MKACEYRLFIALVLFAMASALPMDAQMSPNVSVFANGLFGPRGLKFGPDGNLYVALSGSGGSNSTVDQCPNLQVAGAGYLNGDTGSIISIDPQGNVKTVAAGFASALSVRPDVLGVADVAFLDGQLYAVTSGGGCSHGSSTQPNMVVKVDVASGKWSMLADMSAAVAATPAANIAADFEADGVFYGLIAARGELYTVEANHGQIWSVTKKGDVEMVTDISAVEDHIVPTAAVESKGGLIVGNLGLFPIVPGSSELLTLKPGCDHTAACGPGTLHITDAETPGLTTVVSLAWGPDGLLYVLELSPEAGFPSPGAGKVVRVNSDGSVTDVATGLSLPTGMTFGPDGYLYVSNWGAAPAQLGQILKVAVH